MVGGRYDIGKEKIHAIEIDKHRNFNFFGITSAELTARTREMAFEAIAASFPFETLARPVPDPLQVGAPFVIGTNPVVRRGLSIKPQTPLDPCQ